LLPLSFETFSEGDVNSMPAHGTGACFFDCEIVGPSTLHCVGQTLRPNNLASNGGDKFAVDIVFGCDTTGVYGADADLLPEWCASLTKAGVLMDVLTDLAALRGLHVTISTTDDGEVMVATGHINFYAAVTDEGLPDDARPALRDEVLRLFEKDGLTRASLAFVDVRGTLVKSGVCAALSRPCGSQSLCATSLVLHCCNCAQL
jgi:hypothetical protein